MPRHFRLGQVLLALAWLCLGSVAHATDTGKPPSPPALVLQELQIHPAQVALKGLDDGQQLVLTGVVNAAKQVDVTGAAQYQVVNPKVARVAPGGRVLPLADGETEIVVTHAGKTAKVAVKVTDTAGPLPINFPNQIVPIFTKLGCNSGGCHGKSGGQNGFRLSLLGFEPEVDYMTLVKEARGRRVFPAAPDHSLLLQKGIGAMPHGGGKKLEKDSDEYRLLRRWIASGLPYGDAKDSVVTKLSVFPTQRTMGPQAKQQLIAFAHYSDGRIEDVTRRAQYESNQTDIATVEPTGIVTTGTTANGEAAVMIRYQGHVAVFRSTVPLDRPAPAYEFPYQVKVIDEPVHKKYQLLGLMPSGLCDDATFIRRVSLDICGTLPTPAEVSAFVASTDPAKRAKLVDQLLDRIEYAYYFAGKWADVLRVKRHGDGRRAKGTFAFHEWIVRAMAEDLPYDQFLRSVIAATGDENIHPPVVWYKEMQSFENFVDDTSQAFLGLRMACANCHHHPFEKWSQDDYWGLAAFFGRVGRKQVQVRGGFASSTPDPKLRIFVAQGGGVANKRTGQPAAIKALDAAPVQVPPGEDPRQKLVDWMVAKDNPFVARAVVNRYWAHFFGRGIVDPLDDMRVTNPPSNEELLDALAKEFVEKGFSLKHLVRTIANSRAYQLSAEPNEFNRTDKQNFARFYPRRMSAEVLFDAINRVTDFPDGFGGLPQDAHAPKRAIMLPDEGFTTYFLEVFGKPQRSSACECERVSDANLAQALHLLNSDEVQNKIARGGGRVDQLVNDKAKDDKAKVEELFLWALARKPTPTELQTAQAHIAKLEPNKKAAFENLLWALLNTKEFAFID